MLTLTGTLRQSGDIKTGEGKTFKKLWIETETPPEGDRPGELQIHEFLFPSEELEKVPPKGSQISIDVRSYVRGREIAYKALHVRSAPLTPETALKPVGSK